MHVGILGSTGQIGYALAEHLHSTGWKVTAFRRAGNGVGFPPGIEVRDLPGFAMAGVRDAFSAFDRLVYAIGSPEKWVPDPLRFFEAVNVRILNGFLEAAAGIPGLPITYISTFEVFQDRKGVIRELQGPRRWGATPYYDSMVKAYALVNWFRDRKGLRVTCIHPAAVYGGLNTGMGLTDYLLNLRHRRFWRVPAVPPGVFPVIHVESLAKGMEAVLKGGYDGENFLFADAHLSLRELGLQARKIALNSYVPRTLPLPIIQASVGAMEILSKVTRSPPLLSKMQVKYVTQGLSIDCAKAVARLGWRPMDVAEGLRRTFTAAPH